MLKLFTGRCYIRKEDNSFWKCTWEDDKSFLLKSENHKLIMRKDILIRDFFEEFEELGKEEIEPLVVSEEVREDEE